MALWPFVVAGIWCCGILPWYWRTEDEDRQLLERPTPVHPPATLWTYAEPALLIPFVLYHLPVLLALMWCFKSLRDRRLVALLATIFLTAALYSALFTWVL